MKTLMVDMDDVLTSGMFIKYIEDFYNTKVNLDGITEYKIVQKLTEDKSEEFWNFVKDKDFYDNAPLYDDAYDTLKKLNDIYDVYIVTSYIWNDVLDLSGKNLEYKYNYLRKMLPFIEPNKYIFATNKLLMNFDIKIDDKPLNLEGANTKLLFTAWHNKNLTNDELKSKDIIRVNNWKEIEKELLNNN